MASQRGLFAGDRASKGVAARGRSGASRPAPAAQASAVGADRLVRVAVERSFDVGDGSLTYAAGPEPVRVGARVRVPLGRGRRLVEGVVVEVGGPELAGDIALERIRPLERVLEGGLPEELVRLARFVADYYVCPLGSVVGAMVPAGVKRGAGRRAVRLVERAPPDAPGWQGKLTPAAARARAALAALPPQLGAVRDRELAGVLGLKSLVVIGRLIEAGVLVASEGTEQTGLSVGFSELAIVGDAGAEAPAALSEEQRGVVEGIGALIESFGVHLVHGVTGSGKTEVYLRLIERVLARGRSAIVLVPEISLTPQTAGRFERRFAGAAGSPAVVAVLHSGLTASQRARMWQRATSGEARVVVGARSAVFAPVPSLGLIVVDEEHASDYKQEQQPRYHGRDVAIVRAQQSGVPVVLGSATPSLESWHRATQARADGSARYRLWRLTRRVGDRPMPGVRIVDVIEARKRREAIDPTAGRAQRMLTDELERCLVRTLGEGGQAILLLNRRGYSGYVHCASARCGWVLACDHCDARLVLHRDAALPRGSVLRCHHCQGATIVPGACAGCGGRLQRFALGTQRLEDELERTFVDASLGDGRFGLLRGESMLRIDSDTMPDARRWGEALNRFARGEVRVLLGTQMLAKGHDFPNVRLVGVVSADTAMHMPDFRASERTFQLVAQVAGRAGRGDAPGLVVVQTAEPTSSAIVHAAAHDYEGFAQQELAVRIASDLPPAWRMARIVVRDRVQQRAQDRARDVARDLAGAADRLGLADAVRIDGPMEPALRRLQDMWRMAIELRGPTAGAVVGLLRELRSRGELPSNAQAAVDVDPLDLM